LAGRRQQKPHDLVGAQHHRQLMWLVGAPVQWFADFDGCVQKANIAETPDTLRVDEMNLREYAIINCRGVIIT
jgi:hypothetical protein